ncbi:hypothetical protein DL769_008993 [Monosporascus sp. CRB-8-3]|nr:hypothetical protein DL769_008993 [Monosporascus sp. CRB-8-3]
MTRGAGPAVQACSLASFLWLYYTSDRHSLIDHPQLSSFLLLLVSGGVVFVASVFSKWLPGADGRFDSEAIMKGLHTPLPQRPRRFYVPCIIFLVVVRLQIMHRVVHDLQCSSRGVEAFLPVLLAFYEFMSHKPAPVESDEPEDMWGSFWEDFKAWVVTSPITLLLSTVLFSLGTCFGVRLGARSTYFCSTLVDQRTTLKSAVREYKDRYHGRNPPPNFDKWFSFAQQRKSAIIDKFDQIDKDILPFWGMNQEKIRSGLDFLKSLPDIGVITVADGKVHHNQPSDPSQNQVLDDVVSMISSFSEHLPTMSIAINLKERPRILVPWDDVYRMALSGSKPRFNIFPNRLHRRRVDDAKVPDGNSNGASTTAEMSASQSIVSAQKFHHLQALACPPGSPTRAGIHWNVRDFCAACANPHSQGQFVKDWQKSLDPCHQPDLFNLHDFHMAPYGYEIYQELLPLFSGSKTDSFNDILIPLVRSSSTDRVDSTAFADKFNRAFWQGDVADVRFLTSQSLHGGHRQRLLHLVNNATSAESISILMGTGNDKQMKFHYEDIQARTVNSHLPLSFSFTNSEPCDTADCWLIQQEFGFQERGTPTDKLFVLLLDDSDGPPPELLPVLRSYSVPVLSSIFREWYTERILPWVHFIPIDVRYHGLHSTLSYFIGLKYNGPLNGKSQAMDRRKEDARWIAEEGRKWADKSMRREDMEVYLFRLLLEWGRVIDNNRDSLGFVLEEKP